MLKANFDADGTAIDDEMGVSISGMIDNFMTGAMSRPGWEVELAPEDTSLLPGVQGYEDLAAATAAVMGEAKWSRGGAAMPTMGSWQAMLYGGMTNDFPDAATGTFNASGTTGRISGAFGVMEK